MQNFQIDCNNCNKFQLASIDSLCSMLHTSQTMMWSRAIRVQQERKRASLTKCKHNLIKQKEKGGGGDRINITIGHNLVQPNK